MKLLMKIFTIVTAIVMPLSTFAAGAPKVSTQGSQSSSTTTNNAGNNASGSTNLGTTPAPDTYNTGNPNNTGTTVFDNNTGKIGNTSTTNSANQGYPNGQMPADINATKRNNATQTRQLTLTGLKAQDRGKVIQYARQAGATTARIEGDTLNYSGTEFDQEKFNSLMTGTLPRIGVQDPSTK
jgi:hypothetical protein